MVVTINDSDPITKDILLLSSLFMNFSFFMNSVSVLSFLIYYKKQHTQHFSYSVIHSFLWNFPSMTLTTVWQDEKNGFAAAGEIDRILFSINRKRFGMNAEFTHFSGIR